VLDHSGQGAPSMVRFMVPHSIQPFTHDGRAGAERRITNADAPEDCFCGKFSFCRGTQKEPVGKGRGIRIRSGAKIRGSCIAAQSRTRSTAQTLAT
jgi:hypothetical protein